MDIDLDEEITEFVHDPVDADDVESIDDASSAYSKRGAPKIPVQWTRIISIANDNL